MLDLIRKFIPGGSLTAIGAVILAILAGVWRIFAAGKGSERAKQDRADLNAMKAKKDKDDEVDQLGPADLDDRFTRWMRDKDGR